jgi:hypothetical protein
MVGSHRIFVARRTGSSRRASRAQLGQVRSKSAGPLFEGQVCLHLCTGAPAGLLPRLRATNRAARVAGVERHEGSAPAGTINLRPNEPIWTGGKTTSAERARGRRPSRLPVSRAVRWCRVMSRLCRVAHRKRPSGNRNRVRRSTRRDSSRVQRIHTVGGWIEQRPVL